MSQPLEPSGEFPRHAASPHRRIATGLLWVSLFVLLGKSVGAAREMAVAWRYGVGEVVDAYVFTLNLVSLPGSVWFSVLSVLLIPVITRSRSEPARLRHFIGELQMLTLLCGAGCMALAWFGLPSLLAAPWSGLSAGAQAAALSMVGGLSLLPLLTFFASLLSVLVMASGRHRNTLLESIPSAGVLTAVILPPGLVPEPLVWGFIIGVIVQLLALGWPMVRCGDLPPPRVGFDSPLWPLFRRGFMILALGQVLMSCTAIIDQFFAAFLGPGNIATLSYGGRVMALVLSLGAMAIGRATLPVFSELAAGGARSSIVRLALQWAGGAWLAGLLVTAGLWIAAPHLIALLFERGAFTAVSTQQVTEVFRYLIIQTPFYFGGLVLISLLSSLQDYRAFVVSGLLVLPIKLGANWLLVSELGAAGIALGTALMYAATLIFMVFRVRAQLGSS